MVGMNFENNSLPSAKGSMLTRRFFIGGLAAACALGPRKLFAKEEADFDDNLLVFLSDVHAGAAQTCEARPAHGRDHHKHVALFHGGQSNIPFGDAQVGMRVFV